MLRIYNQKCVLIQSISGRTAASGYIICIMAVYILGLLEARKTKETKGKGMGVYLRMAVVYQFPRVQADCPKIEWLSESIWLHI